MLLKKITTDINPLSTFVQEHGLEDRDFGIYGQNPFTFRVISETEATIMYDGEQLGRVVMQAPRVQATMFRLSYVPTTALRLTDAVSTRIQRAAVALASKIENAAEQVKAREDALIRYSYQVIGPADTSKAVNLLNTPNAVDKLKALMFAGMPQRVLPPELSFGVATSAGKITEIPILITSEDGEMSKPVLRIRTDQRQVWALGPGDRRAGRVAFTENLLNAAYEHTCTVGADPDLLTQARDLIARSADVVKDLGEVVDPFRMKSLEGQTYRDLRTCLEFASEQNAAAAPQLRFDIPDTEFYLTHDRTEPSTFALWFRDTAVSDYRSGYAPGMPKTLEGLTTAAFLSGLTHHGNFMPKSPMRAHLRSVRDVAAPPEIFETLLTDTRTPDVEVFL